MYLGLLKGNDGSSEVNLYGMKYYLIGKEVTCCKVCQVVPKGLSIKDAGANTLSCGIYLCCSVQGINSLAVPGVDISFQAMTSISTMSFSLKLIVHHIYTTEPGQVPSFQEESQGAWF